jgi:uncharacterized protein (DUF2236 family)
MALDVSRGEFQRRWQELLAQAQPAEWVREMIEDYRRTGTIRPENLRRLLGDPTKGVEVGPNASLTSLFAAPKEPAS